MKQAWKQQLVRAESAENPHGLLGGGRDIGQVWFDLVWGQELVWFRARIVSRSWIRWL